MFKPINSRILIRPDEKEMATQSGILLTAESVDRPLSGVVVAGSDSVPAGSHVAFSRYAQDEIMVDRERMYIVSEHAILGIYTQDE